MKKTAYHPIEDYGIIGNGNTTALIHTSGSVDFFCYPDFDSPSVFAKLLDTKKGGFFATKPKEKATTIQQDYISQTNVLLTRHISEKTIIDIIDFMPFDDVTDFPNECIRIVKCIRGSSEISFELRPAYNYGQNKFLVEKKDTKEVILKCDNKDIVSLAFKSNISILKEKETFISEFSLEEGEAAIFRFGDIMAADTKEKNDQEFLESCRSKLRKTIYYWRDWINSSHYKGVWKTYVDRSALLLKLLTSNEHGAAIAAPTFSLPELVGGKKNWDYRYTWIRDASFTMFAFIRLGFLKEASKFIIWVQKRLEEDLLEDKELQIMYCPRGERNLEESTLDHFEGYKGSEPVRIGNAATNQLQLDIFGELMDTIYLFDKHGEAISYEFWQLIEKLIEKVVNKWEEPDHGIWEVREVKRHYLYTRVMCWVAIDRAIRLAEKRSFPYDKEQWTLTRDTIYKDVYTNFWNEDLQSFVHYKGATTVDASLLIMPLVRIISPYDSRWTATMQVIEKTLMSDVLVYRNMGDTDPKNNAEEGTFVIGAFWFVECLSRAGELEKASYYFQKLLRYGNHLGLFAEEIDVDGKFLGNFPQAFSHLGLISAAYSLDRNQDDATFNSTTKYDLF